MPNFTLFGRLSVQNKTLFKTLNRKTGNVYIVWLKTLKTIAFSATLTEYG